MNYQQTIEFLYKKLPMFSRIGSAAFKKDLTNTIALCDHLGNPHKKFKSIHVGGTNGKGSVSHMLAAIFQTAGYKTGLYTSPHLYDFGERIKLNGEMVSEEFVIRFTERIIPLIEMIEPSFFEITVAMAFEYFTEQEVDIAIIEVGLGGRLDSTNIITPELSIITNIGWDHMNMLGNSLEEIASEKAGIIKPKIPAVIGEKLEETRPVFDKTAKERSAPIFYAEEMFDTESFEIDQQFLHVNYKAADGSMENIISDLNGIYQLKNIRTVLAAVSILRSLNWKLDSVQPALTKVKALTGLSGRWEVIHQNPTVVLEVAHNKNGIEQMLEHIDTLSFDQLHVIIGLVKDKDAETVLKLLSSSAHYYFTQAQISRALPAKELQQKASLFKLKGNSFDDVNAALQNALAVTNTNDLIIVCGSIFLVAEVNKQL